MTERSSTPRAIVVGGGLAGLSAGLRAAELGVRTTVLEAGEAPDYLCNTRLAMGFFNVAFRDIGESPAILREAIDRATAGAADPQLADALANSAESALHWLRNQGVRTIVGNWRPGSAAMLVPPAAVGPGLNWRGRGADVMLRRLESRLVAAGSQLQRGVRVNELILRNGRCVGVRAAVGAREISLESDATVIADGGFQADPDTVGRYITRNARGLVARNAGTGKGDGLRMALQAGAAITELGRFYGHVQSRDAQTNPRLWPYPTCDHLLGAGIAVDASGERFADEGRGGVFMANCIAQLADPTSAWAIFDHRAWMERGTAFPLPANPLLVRTGATIYCESNIATLASAAGLPKDRLRNTVEVYNTAFEAGRLGLLIPPRSAIALPPSPVSQPPFYAVPVLAGITYTTGGIAIDAWGRVRKATGGTIAGLYAAGSTTGGHEGGAVAGYTGGLSKALVFGFRVGGALADDLYG